MLNLWETARGFAKAKAQRLMRQQILLEKIPTGSSRELAKEKL